MSTDVCEVKLQSSQRERWTEAAITVCDTRTCVSLFIRVGRFIAKGASELQIATALTAELIGQMFNQKTYGHCEATKPVGVPLKSCCLT